MGYVLGWFCIGLATSLASSVWPFRRGMLGVLINIFAGVVGALAAPSLAAASGFVASYRNPVELAVAAAGALVALLSVHAAWNGLRWAVPSR